MIFLPIQGLSSFVLLTFSDEAEVSHHGEPLLRKVDRVVNEVLDSFSVGA